GDLVVDELARFRPLARLVEIVLVLVGAVRELMPDGLRERPQPGDRPKQTTESERQQAQRVDGVALWMVALVRDFLRQHVHHPELHYRSYTGAANDESR